MKLGRRWKVIWNLAVIFTLIVVVRRWDPPFDDSGMRVTRIEVPDEQNVYADYERIGKAAWERSGRKIWTLREILRDPTLGWPVVHALTESNRTVLTEMELVQSKTRFQVPKSTGVPADDFHLTLHPSLEISCTSNVQQGNIDEAVKITAMGIRYAWHINQEPDSLWPMARGLSVHNTAMSMVRRLASAPETTLDHLDIVARVLRELPLPDDTEAKALPKEYQFQKRILADYERDGNVLFNAFAHVFSYRSTPSAGTDRLINALGLWIGYLPNKTRNLMHDFLAHRIHCTALPANHAENMPYWQFAEKQAEDELSGRRWIRPNFIGEALVGPSPYRYWPNAWKINRNAVNLTRVFVALRLYQLTHGTYPESLQQICPEFLDEVPKDWFDGAPLRYDPSTLTVFSAWPLDEMGRLVDGMIFFTATPLVNPNVPNEFSVFILPPVPDK